MEWTKDDYRVSDDKSEFDLYYIMPALEESYWAAGRSKEIVEESIANSVCLGLYSGDRMIGFARAVTDQCTFAWVCDVMVHKDFRRTGLGKFLMQCLEEHPDLSRCKQWMLRTRDAHGLYEQFGYQVCEAMNKKVEGE